MKHKMVIYYLLILYLSRSVGYNNLSTKWSYIKNSA